MAYLYANLSLEMHSHGARRELFQDGSLQGEYLSPARNRTVILQEGIDIFLTVACHYPPFRKSAILSHQNLHLYTIRHTNANFVGYHTSIL